MRGPFRGLKSAIEREISGGLFLSSWKFLQESCKGQFKRTASMWNRHYSVFIEKRNGTKENTENENGKTSFCIITSVENKDDTNFETFPLESSNVFHFKNFADARVVQQSSLHQISLLDPRAQQPYISVPCWSARSTVTPNSSTSHSDSLLLIANNSKN